MCVSKICVLLTGDEDRHCPCNGSIIKLLQEVWSSNSQNRVRYTTETYISCTLNFPTIGNNDRNGSSRW